MLSFHIFRYSRTTNNTAIYSIYWIEQFSSLHFHLELQNIIERLSLFSFWIIVKHLTYTIYNITHNCGWKWNWRDRGVGGFVCKVFVLRKSWWLQSYDCWVACTVGLLCNSFLLPHTATFLHFLRNSSNPSLQNPVILLNIFST